LAQSEGEKKRPEAAMRVSCAVRVRNANFGGFDGKSALTGLLYCLLCADFPKQLVLIREARR